MKLLLAYNADLNAQDKEGNTPLLVACKNSRWEAALHLLEQPEVNFNRSDKSGTTPLFEGVSKCQYDLVERLLQREARVNCTRVCVCVHGVCIHISVRMHVHALCLIRVCAHM